MADIELGTRKFYRAIFYDRDGRRRFKSTKCTDARAAQVVANRYEREAQGANNATENKTTLGEALEWLIEFFEGEVKARRRSPETLDMHRFKSGHLKRIFEVNASGEIVPFRLSHLEAKHVDAFIGQRRDEGAHENTIAKELVTLRVTLKVAKRKGEFEGDIAAILPFRFAPEYEPRTRYLSQKELPTLLALLPADHAARVAFMIATSANLGESNRAQRIDIGKSAVHIRGTKRTSRKRHVPIVSDWQRDLMRYVEQHAKGADGKLFAHDGGFEGGLKKTCDSNGIGRCSSNDLRRTYCHWMRQSGMPRELVAAAMGHGSTAMVDKVYGKLDADELTGLMERALGITGTDVAQTKAAKADSLHSADKGDEEKPEKLRAGGGTRTHTSVKILDFESRRLELPPPRKYERKREYGKATGTTVAQQKAAAGNVVVLPRKKP